MRTEVLLNNVDASVTQQADYVVDCGQDMRWLLIVEKTATDGNPQMYLEEDVDGVFVPIPDLLDGNKNFFLLNDSPFGVEDSYFMGKTFRIRTEPNGTTTGTLTAKLIVKTKSV